MEALTAVVFVLVEEALRPVVEEVDTAVVERCQDPWPVFMERQALHALAFRLELCLHHSFLLSKREGCLLFC